VLARRSSAATNDGRLDFVCARETDRALLMKYLDARMAGKKIKSPLPTRRFREFPVTWKRSTIHLDDELRQNPKKNKKLSNEIRITVKASALIIPAAGCRDPSQSTYEGVPLDQ